MKIIAEPVKGKDLRAGDLFSTADQAYWDSFRDKLSIGEKVYIRTDTPLPASEEGKEIYRIIIKEAHNGTRYY